MSLFRSPGEESSSDSQSSSDESEQHVFATEQDRPVTTKHHKNKNGGKSPALLPEDTHKDADVESNSLLGSDTKGHANMMTAALLEFYCLSRAADILNAQHGSHKRFTRDSPEVRYLGNKLYTHKSEFLSSLGALAGGIEGEEWGSTRQYYRDNLDVLGVSVLENLNIKDGNGQKAGIAGAADVASGAEQSTALQLRSSNANMDMLQSRRHGFGMADVQKRLTGNENANPLESIQLDFGALLNRPLPLTGSSPVSFPLFQPNPPPPSSHMSRYAMEFSEVKVLGRGSFGEVYHVRNHIDGQSYAIKKIPLSQRRLQQLECGSQNQLETIMKEIRTLARLEHTNVVRYYGAWIEQAHPSGYAESVQEESVDLTFEQTESHISSHGMDDNQSFGIVFEHSESSHISQAASLSLGQDSEMSGRHHRRPSHATVGSHISKTSSALSAEDDDDDDEVESIPRNFSPRSQDPLSTFGGTDDDIFTDGFSEDPSKLQVQRRHRRGAQLPAVILHIQMSLHPISLGSYLNPQSSTSTKPDTTLRRRHCYHLVPSLRLMLDILSGVDYLHSKGIVHRDLKPANIFLSSPDKKHMDGCPPCGNTHGAIHRYCHPRIGDFGLVADISHISDCSPDTQSTTNPETNINPVVGTEFYRPPHPTDRSAMTSSPRHPTKQPSPYVIDETLDVYALGVILFELLYPLNTKMERQLVLNGLTRGPHGNPLTGPCFPDDFQKKLDMGSTKLPTGISIAETITTCLRGMLEPNPHHRWRSGKIKKYLEELLACVQKT
ncbi:protein kinase [Aspergillus sclerotioniger CBS 115572]|uniref:Protein kinase n=1 Tax=Aspergillus sclerotioniger CBS 115572 TaxID=1450535 RepID=A0A317WL79_9EURO|nr:protein kinase [Aspergillus sclerotioniger CBS 115572]PWY87079.1 protein kinase [Aspergillus sclerotioniger CBS 115572]